MSKNAWTILCVVGAVAMAAIAAVAAFLGGCPGQLELANGNTVPMKCHWAFVADTFIGVLGAVIALVSVTCKDKSGRRAVAIGYIACAAIAAIIPTQMAIGLCAMPDMHCHSTAHIVWALCAVCTIIGIIQIVKSDPALADLPKRQL